MAKLTIGRYRSTYECKDLGVKIFDYAPLFSEREIVAEMDKQIVPSKEELDYMYMLRVKDADYVGEGLEVFAGLDECDDLPVDYEGERVLGRLFQWLEYHFYNDQEGRYFNLDIVFEVDRTISDEEVIEQAGTHRFKVTNIINRR